LADPGGLASNADPPERTQAAASRRACGSSSPGKLVQRSWQDDSGNKRQSVEIQVTHVSPDLRFATAEVTKSTAEGLGSSSDGPSAAFSADEKQRA
jgi:hypothetical protein